MGKEETEELFKGKSLRREILSTLVDYCREIDWDYLTDREIIEFMERVYYTTDQYRKLVKLEEKIRSHKYFIIAELDWLKEEDERNKREDLNFFNSSNEDDDLDLLETGYNRKENEGTWGGPSVNNRLIDDATTEELIEHGKRKDLNKRKNRKEQENKDADQQIQRDGITIVGTTSSNSGGGFNLAYDSGNILKNKTLDDFNPEVDDINEWEVPDDGS